MEDISTEDTILMQKENKDKIQKYHFICMCFGTLFSLIATFILLPKIHHSSIDVNIRLDGAFLVYECGILLLFFGTLWRSTVRKFDAKQKVEFCGYSPSFFYFFMGANLHPILAIVMGSFDSIGPYLCVAMWVIIAAMIFIHNVFSKWNKLNLVNYIFFGLYFALALYVIFAVVALKNMKNLVFFLVPSYFLFLLCYLLKKNIIKTKWNEYLWDILLILGCIILFLGLYFKLYLFY